ncbi:hypothetical protein MAR_011758 [Mya arenaria]|uniref:Uncharacterized protein n=1 Tax=Mya arenaria TaxID=6604 RepID=A0ABY7FXN4_MYAAR|nr:hypothetical protein MAR_011758 [Mya arenaria]
MEIKQQLDELQTTTNNVSQSVLIVNHPGPQCHIKAATSNFCLINKQQQHFHGNTRLFLHILTELSVVDITNSGRNLHQSTFRTLPLFFYESSKTMKQKLRIFILCKNPETKSFQNDSVCGKNVEGKNPGNALISGIAGSENKMMNMDKPIRKQFGFNKNVTVKKNGEYLNVYVNHTVYENGELVKEKSRSVWLTVEGNYTAERSDPSYRRRSVDDRKAVDYMFIGINIGFSSDTTGDAKGVTHVAVQKTDTTSAASAAAAQKTDTAKTSVKRHYPY